MSANASALREAWLLLMAGADRQYGGNDGYADNLTSSYDYDSRVSNHTQIRAGALAVIRDSSQMLGIAMITRIDPQPGSKEVRRCPRCEKTTIKSRKRKMPRWRCECGAEFEHPVIAPVDVTLYTARFGDTFRSARGALSLSELSDLCVAFNAQHAMQRLDAIALHRRLRELGLIYRPGDMNLHEGEADADIEPGALLHGRDEREEALRAIRLRRGQQTFRNSLRDRYEDCCVISGCNLPDVLEAAHIHEYRNDTHNQPANGLLLRSDLHTLFDLDLIGIDPDTLVIHVHPKASSEYGALHGRELRVNGTSLRDDDARCPNLNALHYRWARFRRRLAEGR